MTRSREEIGERDLMAYADGLLVDDPQRAALVEAHLTDHPADAARVEAAMRDNEDIRALFAGELARPMPRRLLRAINGPASRRVTMQQAVAAGLAIVIVAASGGWFAGHMSDHGSAFPRALSVALARNHVDASELPPVNQAASAAINGAVLSSAVRPIHLAIPVPDLGAQGFELAGRKQVTIAGNDMIRLVFRAPDTTLNLFVGPRGHEGSASIGEARAGGQTVHHWSAGPLAYALTTDAEGAPAAGLVRMVHNAVRRARFVDDPSTNVTVPVENGEAIAGDDSMGAPPQTQPSFAPARPRQFN